MIRDFFKLALNNLRKRKVRSWLTMIGIFIGIAAVVALIAIGQGLEHSITEQFEELGTDKIFIQPKGQYGIPGLESAVDLTEDDTETVSKTKGVEDATGMVSGIVKVEFDDEIIYQFLIGLEEEGKSLFEEFGSWEIDKGRDVKEGDSNKVSLGYNYGLKKKVFTRQVKVRDRIKINDEEFKVVGTYKKIGNPQDDAQIYTDDQTAREVLGLDNEVQFIIVRTNAGEEPSKVADAIKKELRKARDLEKGKEDFTVQTFEELIESFQTILLVVQVVLIGIAAISLVVGGIGIMNTMYTSVLQRTQEIGVMKAIGAKNRSILSLFVIESGMLGLFGGMIGVVLGMGIAKIVEMIAEEFGYGMLKVFFPWYLILGALLFSFGVGTISGVFPAIRASRMKPVDALRYE
ncbi:ABC transporter permease [Candidatus Woesearchaeota archaeon]|nr:ABC transporter permease [Candidatus Woesearchaeota archaeon]